MKQKRGDFGVWVGVLACAGGRFVATTPRAKTMAGGRREITVVVGPVAPNTPRHGCGTQGRDPSPGCCGDAADRVARTRGEGESAILRVGRLKWWLSPFYLFICFFPPFCYRFGMREGGEREALAPRVRGQREREPRWK